MQTTLVVDFRSNFVRFEHVARKLRHAFRIVNYSVLLMSDALRVGRSNATQNLEKHLENPRLGRPGGSPGEPNRPPGEPDRRLTGPIERQNSPKTREAFDFFDLPGAVDSQIPTFPIFLGWSVFNKNQGH